MRGTKPQRFCLRKQSSNGSNPSCSLAAWPCFQLLLQLGGLDFDQGRRKRSQSTAAAELVVCGQARRHLGGKLGGEGVGAAAAELVVYGRARRRAEPASAAELGTGGREFGGEDGEIREENASPRSGAWGATAAVSVGGRRNRRWPRTA